VLAMPECVTSLVLQDDTTFTMSQNLDHKMFAMR